MPGYYIDIYSESQFGAFTFPVKKNGKDAEEQVEGRVIKIAYYLREGGRAGQEPAGGAGGNRDPVRQLQEEERQLNT